MTNTERTENTKKNAWWAILLAGFLGTVGGLGLGNYWASSAVTSTNDSGNGTLYGIGGGPGTTNAPANNSGTNKIAASTSKAADFRVTMNNLLHEHAVVSANLLQHIYDNKPDVDTLRAQADTNAQAIAQQIANVYGSDAQNQFLSMWRGHVSDYVDYTNALKSGDQNAVNQAKQKLDGDADMMAQTLASSIKGTNKDELAGLFRDHITLTEKVIGAYANNDPQSVSDNQKQAYDQAGKMADILSSAIIQARPDMF
jgi:hypothetical protein